MFVRPSYRTCITNSMYLYRSFQQGIFGVLVNYLSIGLGYLNNLKNKHVYKTYYIHIQTYTQIYLGFRCLRYPHFGHINQNQMSYKYDMFTRGQSTYASSASVYNYKVINISDKRAHMYSIMCYAFILLYIFCEFNFIQRIFQLYNNNLFLHCFLVSVILLGSTSNKA